MTTYILVTNRATEATEFHGDLSEFITYLNEARMTIFRMEDADHLREELIGQPKIMNFIGPMYDGPGRIRYEDRGSYEILST